MKDLRSCRAEIAVRFMATAFKDLGVVVGQMLLVSVLAISLLTSCE